MFNKLKRNDKIGLFFFLAFVLSTSLTWLFEERFDEIQWKRERRIRYKMVEDIIDSKLLIGKTKEEVILLLGTPKTSTGKGRDHLMYSLGKPPSFFEEKEENLVVVFNNDVVIHVLHAQE